MNVKKASQPFDLLVLSETRIFLWFFQDLSQLVKYIWTMQSFSESLKFFQQQEQQICDKMHCKHHRKGVKNDNGKSKNKITCVSKDLYDEPVSNKS